MQTIVEQGSSRAEFASLSARYEELEQKNTLLGARLETVSNIARLRSGRDTAKI